MELHSLSFVLGRCLHFFPYTLHLPHCWVELTSQEIFLQHSHIQYGFKLHLAFIIFFTLMKNFHHHHRIIPHFLSLLSATRSNVDSWQWLWSWQQRSKALANERTLRLLDSSECLIVCYLNVIFPLTAPLSRMIYVSRLKPDNALSLSMKIALAKKLFSSHHHHRHHDNCRRCQPFVYSSNEAQELWMCTTQFVISGTGDEEEEEEECGTGGEKWLVDSTLNSINLIRFISTHISSISFNNSESIIHSSRRFSRSLVGRLFLLRSPLDFIAAFSAAHTRSMEHGWWHITTFPPFIEH